MGEGRGLLPGAVSASSCSPAAAAAASHGQQESQHIPRPRPPPPEPLPQGVAEQIGEFGGASVPRDGVGVPSPG